MIISILTLFPDLYDQFLKTSLVRRAHERGQVDFDVQNLFSLCAPKERIDGPTFGHGAGVLIRPDIVEKAITGQELRHGPAFKIFFSPHGKKLDQTVLKELYAKIMNTGHVALLPARYEGMDARIEEEYADAIISVGDFVLMGGDLPALVLLEGLLRLVPGIVGKQESVDSESFSGPFVDYPSYTEPVEWKGKTVPEVIRSGNHKQLHEWRETQAAQRTVLHHFDWLRSHPATESQELLAQKYIPSHYAVLLHGQVMLPNVPEGTTSVTSIDIHDIARSAATYGVKHYFIVTPLVDQQKIVRRLLDFWQTGDGVSYNNQRHQAVDMVRLCTNLDEVIERITALEGKKPVVIATSARSQDQAPVITYFDQEKIWELDRPILFLFGTGNGLAASVMERCDFVLLPIRGFSEFNHLSVRSAAAVVFDRWLGINLKNLH